MTMKTYASLLGLITASAIFFQFHVSWAAGTININLADPFAILALLTLGLNSLISGKMPQWRIAEFNRILILFGAILLFSYVIGWTKIGTTQWALSARLAGWVVLLGYLSAGYLIVAYIGDKGILRVLEVLAMTAVIVIIWTMTVRLLYAYGLDVPEQTKNFEGFSSNRNAFAFQLLAVLALSLPCSKMYEIKTAAGKTGIFSVWQSWVPMSFLIAGIFWSGSRAGMLAAATLLLVAAYKNIVDRKLLFLCLFFAGLLWSVVWVLQHPQLIIRTLTAISFSEQSDQILNNNIPLNIPDNFSVNSPLSEFESNQERWATLLYGFEMWRQSPIFGEGLGVFTARSTQWFGHSTVIHNTPLWILAEFGLVGAIVFGWFFLKLWGYSVNVGSSRDELARYALLLLLIVFFVFSQFHEMLFQRIIWLIGGALLGAPLISQNNTTIKLN
ncbi:MAG: O-antigen ligase family protein [Burkholderiales bacterium]|nr:O-antigen ligase family protein [Burkholderiales bacterium]MCA3156063.1 O-antigen ligase family protein [Burkholderiales bacterium]MCA3167053.1 O-antigen ligase family protein [Burkholderiales bacterium]